MKILPFRQLLAAILLAISIGTTASAHPGSGIVVDRRGSVYFVDTGGGVWKIDPSSSKLVSLGGPRFHWMAIDENARPSDARLPSIPGGEVTALGVNPTLLLSSDVAVVIGQDGALYYPEWGPNGRLGIVRFTRSGDRSVRATLPSWGQGGARRWVNGLAVGANGSLYYTEDRAVRKIDQRGRVSTLAENVAVPNCARIPGVEPEVGPYLRGLSVAPDGAVFVAASGCGAVLKIAPTGAISVVLRTTSPWSPTAVAVSRSGLYVQEYVHTATEDRRAWIPRLRKVLPNGSILSVATVERTKTR